MVVTLEELRENVGRIERELAEVRRGLDQLVAVPEPQTEKDRLPGIRWVDKASWKEWFDQWFQQIGIVVRPIGAEKLQEMMLQAGVRPEDNLLSHGIIAMREE
jgi:hypothetical protein